MYLGIEIGGSKLQLGIGTGDGMLAGFWRGPVDAAAGAEGIRTQIRAALPELLAKAGLERSRIRGAGIGFGGPVDDATQTVIKSHQIQGWDDFPLANWIAELLGLPTALGNDADVAGLAEALFGAGKGLSPIFYITIGSGIGGGLIINGEIYRGCGRGAGEIGHFSLAPSKDLTWIAEPWVLEEVASGWAIGKRARSMLTRNFPPRSELFQMVCGQVEQVTTTRLGQAAARGDPLANAILGQPLSYLAEVIANLIALLCPRRIVIGGGVSLMGEQAFFDPLRRKVAGKVFKPFASCYDIVPATLGEEVVVHGALALARRRFPE